MSLTRSDIRDLLDRHGLAPSRALGQNFLCDANTVAKIVRLAEVGPGDPVIEIGPGLGSLSVGLLAAGADVVAVEVDRYLLPALAEAVGPIADEPGTSLPKRFRLVHGDAQELDWSSVLQDRRHRTDDSESGSWNVVANLPYNIATPLILDLLRTEPALDRWLVMVQREAGERLTAAPGSKTFGIPSVMVRYWAEADIVAPISREVFLPRPNVDSVLVRIRRRPRPLVDVDFDRFQRLVRTAFGQRRKMLRRSLSDLVADADFERAGVPPTARPESLEVADWARLVEALEPPAGSSSTAPPTPHRPTDAEPSS